MSNRICRICGRQLGYRKKAFCSTEYKKADEAAQKRQHRMERRPSPPPCPECGALVVYVGIGTRKIFCSERCRHRWHNRRRNRMRLGIQRLDLKHCGYCCVEFQPKQRNAVYCSKKCYRRGNQARPEFVAQSRACANCGVLFMTRRYDQRFCSSICSNRFAGRERSRRRSEGPSHCDYTDAEIFERDHWRCHICHRSIQRRLSRMHPRGATIDHLLPLVLGGRDVKANVAAAHRECNSAKNAGAANDQLRLLG